MLVWQAMALALLRFSTHRQRLSDLRVSPAEGAARDDVVARVRGEVSLAAAFAFELGPAADSIHRVMLSFRTDQALREGRRDRWMPRGFNGGSRGELTLHAGKALRRALVCRPPNGGTGDWPDRVISCRPDP